MPGDVRVVHPNHSRGSMLGTVLVVDDEPHIVRAVKNALSEDFGRVLEAGTAREAVHLTPTAWDLLRAFLRHAGKTLTHSQLFQAVWATSSGDPQHYLRVYVANLRRKLEPDPVRPRMIITEPGVGYRFQLEA